MDRLKVFRKYIIWIISFYIFSNVCLYIGFNATYKNITSKSDIPSQINIEVAQATSVNGRIYGTITNDDDDSMEGKYIKIDIFTQYDNYAATKYLKVDDININETKKFAVYFEIEDIKYYTIEIVDDTEEQEQRAWQMEIDFKNIFKDKNTTILGIMALILFW